MEGAAEEERRKKAEEEQEARKKREDEEVEMQALNDGSDGGKRTVDGGRAERGSRWKALSELYVHLLLQWAA